jgi:hypothetical protein
MTEKVQKINDFSYNTPSSEDYSIIPWKQFARMGTGFTIGSLV